MNLLEYNARLLDDLTREWSMPAPKPQRKPDGVYQRELEEFGWVLALHYVVTEEDGDEPEVEIVKAELVGGSEREIEIPLRAIPGTDLAALEDEIREDVISKRQEIDRDRHPSWCRCRDCRDDRGDWEFHSRRDERGPRE